MGVKMKIINKTRVKQQQQQQRIIYILVFVKPIQETVTGGK